MQGAGVRVAEKSPDALRAMAEHRAQIEELFVRWGPMVMRRARAILGNEADAEEATHDVFLKVYDALDDFEGRSQVATWLYRITTNLCLNRLRNQARRKELRALHLSENIAVAGHADRVLARELLLKVPDANWAKAALYIYLDGMTQEEAADVMGVSQRTIRNYLSKLKVWAQREDQDLIPSFPAVGKEVHS